ncbi:MAG TPA: hypothetical protein PKL59_20735 [Nitrospira sp.]|nr:hypothetical protein [Nitrospira sp.]
MSTDAHATQASQQAEAQVTATPESSTSPYGWTIFTADGQQLIPVDSAQLASWLVGGAVSLDDLCAKAGDETKAKIRESVGKKDFDIRVLFDPVGAHVWQGLKLGFSAVFALLFLICAPIGLTYAYMDIAGFGVGAAIFWAVIALLFSWTGVGAIIIGFITAALSHGKLSWIAGAVGPVVGLALLGIGVALIAALVGGLPGAIVGRYRGLKVRPVLS